MVKSAIHQAGVTLIELLVAIAMLAVLMTVAVPSFQTFMINNQVSAFSDQLYASLLLTRSEAIKRNGRVQICRSSNGTACTGSWNEGWIVFEDKDGNSTPSTSEIIFKAGSQNGNFSLSGLPNSLYYDSQGAATSSTNHFAICPSTGSCKYVCVPQYGTPKIVGSSSSCP